MDAEVVPSLLAKADGFDPETLLGWTLKKYSLDARKGTARWRAEFEVRFAGDAEPTHWEPRPFAGPAVGAPHVVVIGAGPAGLFATQELLRAGVAVTLLERGKDVQARRRDIAELNRGQGLNPESNYCFGEGGAGTFSDGKLYTRSGDSQEIQEVLHELVAHGASDDILVSWRPHVGSNQLPKVITALRENLVAAGAIVRFDACVTSLTVEDGSVRGVVLADGEILAADAVLLATGHSALDSLRMATDAGATVQAKGFALGVRVEHSQELLDARQYRGSAIEELPPAFYELSTQINERGVWSFCMCPGGWIVPSSTAADRCVVNGMSLSKRDSPFANSGIVVGLEPKDWCGKRGWRWGWPAILQRAAEISADPLLHETITDPRGGADIPVAEGRLPVHPDIDPFFGVRLQHALEVLAAHAGGGNNKAPAQVCADFVVNREGPSLPSSYLPGLTAANFHDFLPKGVAVRLQEGLLEFDQQLPGFAGPEGQMVGVETRTSSPVRILRDEIHGMAVGVAGLFPAGEGAGWAGGIVSAALDGRQAARHAAQRLLARKPT